MLYNQIDYEVIFQIIDETDSFPPGKFLSFHLNDAVASTRLRISGNAGGKETSPCAESSGCS